MKINMLLFSGEIIAVYSEKFSWYINIMFRKIIEFVKVKHSGTYSKKVKSPVTGPVWSRGFQELQAPRFS
jgi:hypothetical protein